VDEKASGITCDDYSIDWMYGTPKELEKLRGGIFLTNTMMFHDFTKSRAILYLAGKKVKGYKASFTNKGAATWYQYYAEGNINGQDVLVILTLHKAAASNEDIPEFARQIITIAQ